MLNKNTIVKRDGTETVYNPDKMRKFLNWLCYEVDYRVDALEDDINKYLSAPGSEVIEVSKLLEMIQELSEARAYRSDVTWLKIAGRAYILSVYKANKHNGLNLNTRNIPKDFADKFEAMLKNEVHGFRDSKDDYTTISDLVNEIDFDSDFELPIYRAKVLMEKYGRVFTNEHGNDFILPPSLIYALHGIALSYEYEYEFGNPKPYFDLKDAISYMKDLRNGYYTMGSAVVAHAGRKYRCGGNCTVIYMSDSTEGIGQTLTDLQHHSKGGSGNSINIHSIRASGSKINSIDGTSEGAIKFIRQIDSTLKAFNQGGKRRGAGVVNYPAWHKDVMDFIPLKATTGSPEQRIRDLKYSIAFNDVILERAKHKQYIHLFCPNEVLEVTGSNKLITATGQEFTDFYDHLCGLATFGILDSKKVPALEVVYEWVKYRYNHGNNYCDFVDNINKYSMIKLKVHNTQLCCEVTLPARRNT